MSPGAHTIESTPNAGMAGKVDETLVALPRDRAAKLADVSERRVTYWSQIGLLHPLIDKRVNPHRPVWLYGYTELMSLMVIAELRNKISLQEIRHVVDHLRRLGYPRPLTELRFAVVGGKIYFEHPVGHWEHHRRPGQIVFDEVLDLEPMRAKISRFGAREKDGVGKVEKRRVAMGSKPLVAGTRVPVATVKRYLDAGKSTKEILAAFPVLREADVEVTRRSRIAS
jgi:uncharacterized protein (DUF433 family)/DNA-binding transcriptional MerR regulator